MNAPRAWPCSVLWPEALDTNAATRAAPLPLPQGFTPDGDGSPCARLTRKGCRASITYLTMPRAIRRSVASARGRARSKMLGVGSVQSMHSAALRHGINPRALVSRRRGTPWVVAGHLIGWAPQRAPTNQRRRGEGAQFLAFDLVAQIAQAADPLPEGLAFALRARSAIRAQRPPSLELLDVLQADDARLYGFGPLDHDPGQRADFLARRFAALGFGKMLAVRAGP